MLWRDTHEARYLDFAERLLFNAYLANQWPSGGFGHRRLGFDDLGVYAWLEPVAESFWCCSFHGPLGYYELKEFFAVGTDEHQKTILYNFPLDFSAPIQFSDALWTVDSTPLPPNADAPVRTAVRLTPDRSDAETALSVRLPDWAGRLVVRLGSRELAGTVAHGRWNADEPIRGAVELEIDFLARPFLEDRRFQKIEIPDTLPTEFPEAVLRWGPNVYLMKIDGEPKIPDLALNVDKGRLALPEAAVCMADLSAEERAGKFAFVFRAKLNQA